MTTQSISAISKFPMGPHVRKWLNIEESEYTGHHNSSPSTNEIVNFSEYVLEQLTEMTPSNPDHLVDILEEFVGMNLPLLAIKLVDANPSLFPENDFRAQLHLGNAAMLVGDLARAEIAFSTAQKLVPEEPAPYVNLTQIYCHDGMLEVARRWCFAGLNVEPNHLRLWELLAWIEQEFHKSNDEEKALATNKILAMAQEKNSWAGLSLHCDLTAPDDILAKAALMDRFWSEGTYTPDFLVEYTAVLGLAGQYDRIPSIVWKAEKNVQKTGEKLDVNQLPWQLYLHLAQSYMGLGRDDDAKKALEKLNSYNGLPDSALQARAALLEEMR